ncbi:hypothetical protein ANO14919_094360 [Xylariales sp. No.14919]|nr:hypothetical protein F5X98DRAFT_390366 [Xylaria grammica]GAW19943.1 hypothetical protein ANO14919_094360 [Xylariales sp. No.14919]
MRLSPPTDPRNLLPSRAHPEQRHNRKQLEKQYQIGLTEVGVLGLIGLTLAWNIEHQVQKCEQRKDKEEAEQKKREGRERHQRGNAYYDATTDPRRNHRAPDSSRSSKRSDWDVSESSSRDRRRRQSVGYRADSNCSHMPRHSLHDDRRYGNQYQYNDPRDTDLAGRRRSHLDSW